MLAPRSNLYCSRPRMKSNVWHPSWIAAAMTLATSTKPGEALELGERAWLRLAESRQKTHPAQALPVYWRLIDSALETADRRAYAAAVRLLKRARDVAAAGCEVDAFEVRLAALRERHRRRPSLIAMLDKAKLAAAPPS